MTGRGRRAGVALAVLLAVTPGRVAAAGGPAVTADRAVASPGQSVRVEGTGWSPGAVVQVEVCGAGGQAGSDGCDLARARTVPAVAGGRFVATVVVGVPPAPCPCVVRASSSLAAEAAHVPLDVVGAPSAPVAEAPPALGPRLRVVRAELEGAGPWQAWFGATPRRTLVLTVRNANAVPVPRPPFVLTAGGRLVAAPDLGVLGPGERRTYRIPVDLPSLTMGTARVQGRVGWDGAATSFSAEATAWPWGLVVVAVLLVQAVLLRLRDRARRRLAPPPARPSSPFDPLRPPVASGIS